MNVIALHLIVLQLLTPLNAGVNKLYDNEDIAGEYDSSGNLLRSYIHGPGIDEPIRMTDHSTSTNYYYLADGLGSITEIQDSTGATVEKYRYDSFGNPTILAADGTELTESAISNPYMFTAREYDTEMGLYYYRARYYGAGAGRFLSEDPILEKQEYFENIYVLIFPQNLYKYSYVNSNPVNFTDPEGLSPISIPGGQGQGIGIGPISTPIPVPIPIGKDKAKEECEEKKPCPSCPDPPPPEIRIDLVPPSAPHPPCRASHIHVDTFVYDQNPITCKCYLRKIETVFCL